MATENAPSLPRDFVIDEETQFNLGKYATAIFMESGMVLDFARQKVKTPIVVESFEAVEEEARGVMEILREATTMLLVGEAVTVEPVVADGGGTRLQLKSRSWTAHGLIDEKFLLAGLESDENLKTKVEQSLATGAVVTLIPTPR